MSENRMGGFLNQSHCRLLHHD